MASSHLVLGLEVIDGFDNFLDFHRRLNAIDDFLHGLVCHGALVDGLGTHGGGVDTLH